MKRSDINCTPPPPDPAARCGATLPGQLVLVLQGGGALGAFQAGVYEAMHEAGIDPHWVVGTSIGAINAALIAGNPPERRVERLHAFWDAVEHRPFGAIGSLLAGMEHLRGFAGAAGALLPGADALANNWSALTQGVPGFYRPSTAAWLGPRAVVGVERAAWYDTSPLRETLAGLVDFDSLHGCPTRLTVGAVNARTGAMRYFDSREQPIGLDHVMASGALPPAFPAVRIDGEPYWDGGIYSNTPTEVVFDDNPRRDSVIFSVQLWNPEGSEPTSIWDVAGRHKEIQYASRAGAHILKLEELHRLRHVIRELSRRLPPDMAGDRDIAELAAWGCGTTMRILQLQAPRLAGEDHTKDIDFSPAGIRARREAGYAQAKRAIEAAPWNEPVDPVSGVALHAYA
jgi:NTE family protein